jgi:hypothetical protein
MERSPEMLQLINIVEWAPSEFAADMLITIADSPKVAEADWKKELLQEAFRVAAKCKYRMPQKAVGPYPVDTRAGYLGLAFGLRMDTLSLQCRVIQSMLPLDKAMARQLFDEIEKPKLPVLSCGDGLVYEVSDLYRTAGRLVKTSFSLGEQRRGEHIRFLELLIGDITSPLQIAPVLNLIRTIEVSRDQRASLVEAFVARLAKVSGDDRSFSSSIYSVGDEIARLLHTCKEQDIATIDLLKAVRSYYVRHFGASRCTDTLRAVNDTGLLPRQAKEFNASLRALGEAKIFEIDADQVKPSEVEGKVDVHFYWESAEAAKLMRDFKALRFGTGNKPLSAAEKESDQWKRSLSDFLSRLTKWRPDEKDSVADYLHQKSLLFHELLGILPPGPERDTVTREFAAFLYESEAKFASAIEWFWHAKKLLPASFNKAPGEGSEVVRAELNMSKSMVLYAYSQMWKTLSSQASSKGNTSLPTSGKP